MQRGVVSERRERSSQRHWLPSGCCFWKLSCESSKELRSAVEKARLGATNQTKNLEVGCWAVQACARGGTKVRLSPPSKNTLCDGAQARRLLLDPKQRRRTQGFSKREVRAVSAALRARRGNTPSARARRATGDRILPRATDDDQVDSKDLQRATSAVWSEEKIALCRSVYGASFAVTCFGARRERDVLITQDDIENDRRWRLRCAGTLLGDWRKMHRTEAVSDGKIASTTSRAHPRRQPSLPPTWRVPSARASRIGSQIRPRSRRGGVAPRKERGLPWDREISFSALRGIHYWCGGKTPSMRV